MKKSLLKINLLGLALLSSINAFAQEECGTDHVNEIFYKNNPEARLEYERVNAKIKEEIKSGKFKNFKKVNGIIEIPIVVHLFINDGSTGRNGDFTDQHIIDWVNYTNKLYDGTAQSDKSTFEYPFKLILAKRTPQNTPTNGINRVDWSNNSVFNQYGMKYNSVNGIPIAELLDTAKWDPLNYYNVYVVPKFDGGSSTLNGYAYYPTNHGSHLYDHTVLGSHVVQVGHATLGHEVGHALGLAHVFGNSSSTACGTTGDDVDDTSTTMNGNYYRTAHQTNQPVGLVNPCTNEVYDDIIWNVLNYGSQPRVILTEGQTNRSLALFQQYRTSFLTSLATEEPSTTSEIPIAGCVPQNITAVSGLAEGSTYSFGITKLVFGNINSVTGTHSGPTPVFYHDYTLKNNLNSAYSTEVTEGDSITITFGIKNPHNNKFVVYIDYNNDGIFQSNELVTQATLQGEAYRVEKTTSSVISIPLSGVVRDTPLRMRVIGDFISSNFEACGDRAYGEVEDYTVIVKEAKTTVWDGASWSAGLPTSTKEAIVRGDLVIDEALVAEKFTLESGSVVLNSTLTTNQITNNLTADKFVIKGAGVYQINADAEANGEFTVIQNSSPMILNDATLWSSPVSGQNVRNFSPNTLLKRFYKYNEVTNKFASLFEIDTNYPNDDIKQPSNYTFETGLGYHIRVAANQSATVASEFEGKFVGSLNNGLVTIPVTASHLEGGVKLGYNLVGNPYPSSINANAFLALNPNVNTLYFWTQDSPLTSNGYASNNYASYTIIGGVKASSDGEEPNGTISKGQGFFVEVDDSGTVKFDNTIRSLSTDPIVMHKGESPKRIWIDLYEGSQSKNQILLAYASSATNDIDKQIDGKMNPLFIGSKLYSLINNSTEQFVIQGRDITTFDSDIVKLGFEAKSAGVYTIKLANIENIANQSVYLRDKQDNQVIDLTKTSYQFNSEAGTFDERFELVYKLTTLSTTDLDKLSNDVNVVKTSTGLKVISTKELSSVEVYDISGRQVYSKSIKGLEALITGLSKSNQLLVVKVTTKEGKIVNTKVIY